MKYLMFKFVILFITPLSTGYVPNMQKPDLSTMSYFDQISQKIKDGAISLMENATVKSDIECLTDVIHVTEKYNEKQYWPYYMLDASGFFGPGMYHWNRMSLGSWEECLTYKLREDYRVSQYCLLSIDFKNAPNFEKYGFFIDRKTSNYHMGICVPESCHANFLTGVVNNLSGIDDFATITINEGDCHKRDETKRLTNINWAVIGIFITLAVILILSTLYDLRKRFMKQYDERCLLRSFSLYSNSGSVLGCRAAGGTLEAVVGIRGAAIQYVVYIHVFVLFMNGNVSDALYGRVLAYNKGASAAAINGAFYTPDTFLFLSGAMTILAFYRQLKRKESYDPITAIIKRYLRYTLPLGLMIFIRMGLSEQLGEGPVYNLYNNEHQQKCNITYQSILLGYANYAYYPYEMCFVHSWYVPLDLQLYAISQIILILAVKHRRIAIIMTILLGIGTTCVTGITAYIKDVGPTPFIDRYLSNFKYDFAYPHTRGSSWFYGMAFGFLMNNYMNDPPQLTRNWKLLGWLLAKVSLIGCVHLMLVFNFINYSQPGSALFLALYRIIWSAGHAWIVFAVTFSYGGRIGALLTWGPLQFLGSLSFEIFLWHIPIIDYVIATARETWHITPIKIFSHFCSVLLYSILLAVLTAISLTVPLKITLNHLVEKMEIFTIKTDKEMRVNLEVDGKKIPDVNINGTNGSKKESEKNNDQIKSTVL